MPIKVGLAVLLIIGLAVFFWFKFSPSQQIPNFTPTSQQTSKKGLDSHEMPKLLDIEVKSDVAKDDEEKMRAGFKIMDFYLNQWFGHSITKKSTIKIEASSDDSRFVKEADRFAFYYKTGSRDWLLPKQMGAQFGMDLRNSASAHEYTHLYQMSQGCAHPGRSGEVVWFTEGEAVLLSFDALDKSGNLPFFFRNRQWLPLYLKQLGGGIKSLETYSQGSGAGLDNLYPYFALAVDFLMKNREIKTLDDFCVNLGKGQELSVAFQNAFGVSFEKFRSDFEAYFTQTFSKSVEQGGAPPSGGGNESQIPRGYSSWQEFCKVQPKDSRCTAYKP